MKNVEVLPEPERMDGTNLTPETIDIPTALAGIGTEIRIWIEPFPDAHIAGLYGFGDNTPIGFIRVAYNKHLKTDRSPEFIITWRGADSEGQEVSENYSWSERNPGNKNSQIFRSRSRSNKALERKGFNETDITVLRERVEATKVQAANQVKIRKTE